jgi:ribonuclease P protein component
VATRFGHPATARLRDPQDFLALRRTGKRFASRFFSTQFRSTPSAVARLGMAVSRRVSKRAVVRNRIRRAIRESFRLHRAQLGGCDVLLIAQPHAALQAGAALRDDLDSIWKRLSALKPCASTRTIAPGS